MFIGERCKVFYPGNHKNPGVFEIPGYKKNKPRNLLDHSVRGGTQFGGG